MTAEFLSISPDAIDAPEIERAAEALARGRLVAFPTETVYGLAANAAIGESVERLRAVKGRDAQKPFTVHLGSRDAFANYVPGLSPLGRRLVRKAWPGPLTLICPVDDPAAAPVFKSLSPSGAASVFRDGTVGLRCPDHNVALALLHGSGVPVIASSANPAGAAPPTDADQIMAEMGDQVDIILDAGVTRHRKASTIVRLNGEGYDVVRPGVWDERTVRRLATLTVLFVCSGNTCRSPMAEALFKKMLAERLGCTPAELADRGVVVLSAGTGAFGGGRASAESVEVVRRRGADIADHVPRPLTPDLVFSADHIFAMARHHLDTIRSVSPSDAAKASLLDRDRDVPDPVGGPIEEYECAADQIERALKDRLTEVLS